MDVCVCGEGGGGVWVCGGGGVLECLLILSWPTPHPDPDVSALYVEKIDIGEEGIVEFSLTQTLTHSLTYSLTP